MSLKVRLKPWSLFSCLTTLLVCWTFCRTFPKQSEGLDRGKIEVQLRFAKGFILQKFS